MAAATGSRRWCDSPRRRAREAERQRLGRRRLSRHRESGPLVRRCGRAAVAAPRRRARALAFKGHGRGRTGRGQKRTRRVALCANRRSCVCVDSKFNPRIQPLHHISSEMDHISSEMDHIVPRWILHGDGAWGGQRWSDLRSAALTRPREHDGDDACLVSGLPLVVPVAAGPVQTRSCAEVDQRLVHGRANAHDHVGRLEVAVLQLSVAVLLLQPMARDMSHGWTRGRGSRPRRARGSQRRHAGCERGSRLRGGGRARAALACEDNVGRRTPRNCLIGHLQVCKQDRATA